MVILFNDVTKYCYNETTKQLRLLNITFMAPCEKMILSRTARGLILVMLLAGFIAACRPGSREVDTGSEKYRKAVSDFYVSLAAAQTDEAVFSYEKMNQVAEAYPREPAAWANLGVYAMRQGSFELAEEHLNRALAQAPDHSGILHLAGLLQSRWGRTDEAIEYFRQAVESNPQNLMIHYSLVLELERQDTRAHTGEVRERLEQMHRMAPDNQAIIYELARVAGREENLPVFREHLERLSSWSHSWSREAKEQLEILQNSAGEGDFSEIRLELSFLRNMLDPAGSFQDDLADIRLAPNEVGYPIPYFLELPSPEPSAADKDTSITFTDSETDTGLPDSASLVVPVTLLDELPPVAVAVTHSQLVVDRQTLLDFPSGGFEGRLPASALAQIDYNNDFMNDLAMAWKGGFRLYRQNEDRTFTDISAELGLDESIMEKPWKGVWAADLDQDGDLDLVLASPDSGPVTLRNNADGTFTVIDFFALAASEAGKTESLAAVHEFHWVDLDGDGASDALLLTEEGELLHFRNLRGGRLEWLDSFGSEKNTIAISLADLDADGRYEVLAVRGDLSIDRYIYRPEGEPWLAEPLLPAVGDNLPDLKPDEVTLFVQDLDNNGGLDLLVSTPHISYLYLSDRHFDFQSPGIELPGGISSVFDMDGDERLDLLGTKAGGEIFRLTNRGSEDYRGLSLRTRASGVQGDGRINSFGIGGEMEIRAGLLYQKQPIYSPILHFGLGRYEEADMVRITWPNGSVQAEFAELGMGSTIQNEQILKGSCPWLFTNDGEQVHFITDALWRSPLGLRINAQETAGVVQTLDRVKIPGDRLPALDGIYDLRITAELWETHFFDYTGLIAVDHPEGTEIFVDERFVFPAPDLSARIMSKPEPAARVTDSEGRDVSDRVRRRDGDFLGSFQKTAFQGLVEEHFIEIDIGDAAPAEAPLWLLAYGWLRPTDSSINLALSQGSHEPPSGLRIEVPDGNGGWQLLHSNYGVPAGKLKTILLDLEGAFTDPSDRRIRMYTTSEIYWDAIRWAEKLPEAPMVKQQLRPLRQELRYRGYSRWYRPDDRSPMLPDYNTVSGTAARWKDLEGYHTRFGEVGGLLEKIDDRYVIMNAGDELVLEYEAPDDPGEGWTRSFIFVSDGWVKDGDYNTEASATVGPLPWHGQADYDYQSGVSLLEDSVYHRFRDDWVYYHTRYVTPEPFRSSLIFGQPRESPLEFPGRLQRAVEW